jgi:hypothetical protein
MRRLPFSSITLLVPLAASGALAALAACGNNVVVGPGQTSTSSASSANSTGPGGAIAGTSESSSGASTTTSTSTMSSSGVLHGDCTSDADCAGGSCVALTPGGWAVCSHSYPQVTGCSTLPDDQCCKASDCMGTNAGCYESASGCGGPPPNPGNVCESDECTDDADCASLGPSICTPPGVFGSPVRTCMRSLCHTDEDCNPGGAGVCQPVVGPCCPVPLGLACVYPGNCSKTSDCSTNGSEGCTIDASEGDTMCSSGVVCPG